MEGSAGPGVGGSEACLRCGECCRRHQVRLDLAEADSIAAGLGLTGGQFRERFADRRWPGETSLLLRHESGRCPFLGSPDEKGDELCAIDDFKPLSCREWQAGLHRHECRAGLARRWGLVVGPGGGPAALEQKMAGLRLFIDLLVRDRRT